MLERGTRRARWRGLPSRLWVWATVVCVSWRKGKDELRLGLPDSPSWTVYIDFSVALDWARFQATSNAQLCHLARDVPLLPAVQGSIGLAAASTIG